MNPSTDLSSRLQTAIGQAQTVQQHPEANQTFEAMLADLKTQSPEAADLLAQLWQEYISSKRSSLFWE